MQRWVVYGAYGCRFYTATYQLLYGFTSPTVHPPPPGAANALGASTAAVDPTALQPSASQLTLPSTFSIQSITVPHTAVSYVVPGTPSQLPMNVTFSFIYQNMGSSVKRPLAVVFNELGVNSNWYSTLAQSWAERGFAVAVFDFYKPLFLPTSVSQQVLGIPRMLLMMVGEVVYTGGYLVTLCDLYLCRNTYVSSHTQVKDVHRLQQSPVLHHYCPHCPHFLSVPIQSSIHL